MLLHLPFSFRLQPYDIEFKMFTEQKIVEGWKSQLKFLLSVQNALNTPDGMTSLAVDASRSYSVNRNRRKRQNPSSLIWIASATFRGSFSRKKFSTFCRHDSFVGSYHSASVCRYWRHFRRNRHRRHNRLRRHRLHFRSIICRKRGKFEQTKESFSRLQQPSNSLNRSRHLSVADKLSLRQSNLMVE